MATMTRARDTREHVPKVMMARYYPQRATAILIISEAISISREGMGWTCHRALDDRADCRLAGRNGRGSRRRRPDPGAPLAHDRIVHPAFLGGAQPVSASGTTAPGHAHTYAGKHRACYRRLHRATIPADVGELRMRLSR